MTPQEAKDKAFAHLTIGIPELARRLEVSPHAIYQWRRVPKDHCLLISELCGGVVTLEQLYPELFAHQQCAA